ncbi:DUF3108 domain-containing protein [Umboniibacter marinipuniceus]|uniref:Uncharacterized protein DUF3108 n=1 Tax=Umboniibacter marinipuniceus TaxID=569599 RepID=A0A3M0A9T8_9GAMM|nr:DUF3108 domain-containing protein [Umboniibacter marinipuniceus]RMA81386.1 uncharacterized protein DUF3108 [Umboniibacter marinipuniceus]
MENLRTGITKLARPTLLLALLWNVPISAAESRQPYEATYQGRYSGLEITATRSFSCEHQDTDTKLNNCSLSTVLEAALGTIAEESLFRVEDRNIEAQSYRYDQRFFLSRRSRSIDFNTPGAVIYEDRHGAKTIPIEQPYLDNLSYQYALSLAAINGDDTVEIPIIRRGKTDLLRFVREGSSEQQINGETISTVRFIQRREDKDKTIEVWLAPALAGVMTSIRYTEDDSSYSLNISSLKFL